MSSTIYTDLQAEAAHARSSSTYPSYRLHSYPQAPPLRTSTSSESSTSSSSSDSSNSSSSSSYSSSPDRLFTRASMDSSSQPRVVVLRCSRCAKCVETVAGPSRSNSDLKRVSTDDANASGMVRFGHNLYYCERCAKMVGYK